MLLGAGEGSLSQPTIHRPGDSTTHRGVPGTPLCHGDQEGSPGESGPRPGSRYHIPPESQWTGGPRGGARELSLTHRPGLPSEDPDGRSRPDRVLWMKPGRPATSTDETMAGSFPKSTACCFIQGFVHCGQLGETGKGCSVRGRRLGGNVLSTVFFFFG